MCSKLSKLTIKTLGVVLIPWLLALYALNAPFSMVIWFFLLITLKKYLAFKIKTVKSFIDFVKDVWNLEWGMNEIEHMLIHMYFFI